MTTTNEPVTTSTEIKRNALRGATLGRARTFEKRIVLIDDKKFEIRQPTIKERGEIQKVAMKFVKSKNGKDSEAEFDMFAFLICAVINLTYVPDTEEKVFSDDDYNELVSMPAGGWFDKLTKEAADICNVKDDEVKKDSDKTDSA
jgi:hypothetical protein